MSQLRTSLVLLLTGGLLILAAALIPQFAIEPNLAHSLPPESPSVRLSGLLDTQGESRRSLFLVLRGNIDESQLADFAEDLNRSPFLERVEARRSELFSTAWQSRAATPLWHLPTEKITAISQRLQSRGRRAALQATMQTLAEDPLGGREVAFRDPLGLRWLLQPSTGVDLPFALQEDSEFLILKGGKRALLRLVGNKSSLNAEFSRVLLDDIEQRIAQQAWACDMLGGYVIARADANRIRADLQSSIFYSSILVLLYLAFSLRGFGMAMRIMAPIGAAIFCAVSIGASLFGPLTPVAIASAAVLLGLGIDYGIHYVVRYTRYRASTPHPEAVAATQRSLGAPLLVGMLTTATAFFSLAFGDFSGLANFGMLLALGLGLAFLATWFLLPILLARGGNSAKIPSHSVLAIFLDHLADGFRGKVIGLAICLLAACAAGVVAAHGLSIQVGPEHLRPENDEVSQTRSRLEQELGIAMTPAFLLTPTGSDHDKVRAAISQLQSEGHIALTTGSNVNPETRREVLDRFHTQTQGWMNATLADMTNMGFQSEAFRPGLEKLQSLLEASPSNSKDTNLIAMPDGQRRVELCYLTPGTLSASKWLDLQARTRQLLGKSAAVYGTPSLLKELQGTLRHDLIQAAAVTAILTLIFVLVMSQSLIAGLFSLLPALCGLSITLAALSITKVPLSLGNFVALPFLLGIAVDDGVHLVAHLKRNAGFGTGATGVAVVRTSLTTILAFGSLCFAQSPGLASMGWIIALGVSCCLFTSLLVLPPLWPKPQ